MAELTLFEEQRDRLWGIAYRITGSVADADDAVQESWLRWQRLPDGEARDPRAYLTTVVSRICYDQLGSARARREAYVGPWLPEPVISEAGPEDRVTLDESVGMAMMTVLERLTPAERTAFILHDVFAVPFTEIADAVGRTPDSVRQLASRARRRVRAEAPRRSVDRGEHRRAVDAFLAAVMGGDFDGLLEILDPDVVWRSDGGGKVTAARQPVLGPVKVARFTQGLMRAFDPATMRFTVRDVNGAPGLVFTDSASGLTGVYAFTVHGGRITEIDVVINPDKLRHLSDAGAVTLPGPVSSPLHDDANNEHAEHAERDEHEA
ncbi:RNA polymerase sigma factor SigJ [Streptomyces sp. NPDC059828]|uniref:RNA polymerase sigma factor SigJ n=1 Tax=Streptomyces sp. NPDC059828 TaxID=3346965 RepID=UPI003664A153